MSTVLRDVAAVRDAISNNKPFCTGTNSLINNAGLLFFRKDDVAGWVDLAAPTEPKLQALLAACEPAPFGVNNKDVLDDTYRKAWKLDNPNFSTRLDVIDTGIIEHVRSKLVDVGCGRQRKVRSELYKLNVYGPGSFFKAHKDTPRSERMFASLVVVFPTQHEGGVLHLRHKGEEWTFDSATITSAQKDPSIAYIAFYSDVEHEVSVVTSGHRVTLTYNLYFDDTLTWNPGPLRGGVTEEEVKFRQSLSALLDNKEFLPEGGYLGFGLRHQYPIKAEKSDLENLIDALKGSDAVITRIADELNLRPELKLVYDDDDDDGMWDEDDEDDGVEGQEERESARTPSKPYQIILGDANQYPESLLEDSEPLKVALASAGGIFLCSPDEKVKPFKNNRGRVVQPKKVYWVTELTKFSRVRSAFAAFGNHGSIGYSYGDLCLILEVPGVGRRVREKESGRK